MFNGQMLNDRYKILQPIGGGGMANVYLARDIILNRDVAIKVLRMDYANDDEFIERFRREAQATISLSHPNIVNIFDVGEEDGDIYYIVMEYVRGMTLKQYIQYYGPLQAEKAVDIMKQVTAAISHAHENGIVHRDIKPQNILIDETGKIKVTDFGIAMALSSTTVTQTNSVLGSVHYLSPEQARGGVATKKSDIYSLGIVFFELLTGRLPFSGDSAVSIALKHLQSDPPSLRRWVSDIPQSVENVVLKATAKNPLHRYESTQQMGKDLESVMLPERENESRFEPPIEEGEETKAIPVITPENYRSRNRKHDDTIVRSPGNDKEKQKKNRRWTPWIVTGVLTLVAAGIIALFLLPRLLMPEEVEIIDVSGLTYEEAYDELRNLKLDVDQEKMNSDEVEEGYVIKTEPKQGSIVKEGSKVTVITSLGKEKREVNDYIGKQFQQIEILLKDELAFKDVIAYEKHSDEPVGSIITQIQPSPGSLVIPEETVFIFEISKGPPKILLEPLAGKIEEEARQYLVGHDLSIHTVREFSNEVPEGHVIEQEPAPYTEVERGDEITVYISDGPEPKPPVTKSVTVSLNYDELKSRFGEQNGNGNGNGNGNKERFYIKIYIEDMNRDLQDVAYEDVIEGDKEYHLDLLIEPDDEAKYKITVNDEYYREETVQYSEG
ncbi:Stk1 family PASTA domain-containing Ser/Thr kinase [Salirhabdus salicampi]|uniref:Stk1 family PASTA domain-containing Ser/Thr kinase n=1 Tax=Salirhabdus salicampi TaxID=476102 RepID=UPI0020C3C138|nr:Stk1 family PASTA domain-containing Ser/Thr kinase [Salirhabdus salicampi]MCP8616569.1 Stk1 family PASTA domain-containing Ser/Thr kinase [Salirhabdus salicampi]